VRRIVRSFRAGLEALETPPKKIYPSQESNRARPARSLVTELTRFLSLTYIFKNDMTEAASFISANITAKRGIVARSQLAVGNIEVR